MAKVSVHYGEYDIEAARTQKDYGRKFTRNFQIVDIKKYSHLSEVMTERVWSPIVFAGGHRKKLNYVTSRFLVLDFDGGYTLAQALNDWCDSVHIIGTSKSHQREKNGIVCDRFRLVTPYNRDIVKLREYNYNYALAADKYNADTQTKDGGRLFYPCTSIVSLNVDGYLHPVIDVPPDYYERPDPKKYAEIVRGTVSRYTMTRRLQPWVTAFLERGECFAEGRNKTTWLAALRLFECGMVPDEVADAIRKAPIDRQDFGDEEIDETICKAWERFTEDGGLQWMK